MGTFGWAYINCEDSGSATTATNGGPTGSVQYLTGANATSGSENLLYHTAAYGPYAANTMVLSGTLLVSGTISASVFHVEDIAVIDATGSTRFGDSNDDTHIRTGSMYIGKNGVVDSTFTVDLNTSQTVVRGQRVNYYEVSSSTHTSSQDDYILGVQASGEVVIRLHSASTANSGALVIIKDQLADRGDSIWVSASAGSGDVIDGVDYYQITGSLASISLFTNGTAWYVF